MVHPHDLDDLGVPPWLRRCEILQPLSRSIPSFESSASRLLLLDVPIVVDYIPMISPQYPSHTHTHTHTLTLYIYTHMHTHTSPKVKWLISTSGCPWATWPPWATGVSSTAPGQPFRRGRGFPKSCTSVVSMALLKRHLGCSKRFQLIAIAIAIGGISHVMIFMSYFFIYYPPVTSPLVIGGIGSNPVFWPWFVWPLNGEV